MQNKFDFYQRIGYDEKQFLNLFQESKTLVLIVLPNNFINRELFQNYIYNITEYDNDKKDYSTERITTSRKQLIVCNKYKFK
jgi:hypothetical protein